MRSDSADQAGTDQTGTGPGNHTAEGVAAAADPAAAGLLNRHRAYRHDCERGLRYHSRRRAFFERWHRWAMFGVILSGSSVIATIGDTAVPTVLAVLTAVIAAADLAFAPAERAREHAALARRFILLLAEHQDGAPTDESLRAFGRSLLAIYADEPPPYYALDALCFNEVVKAWGDPEEHYIAVSGWQRWFANLWPFAPTKFPRPDSPGA